MASKSFMVISGVEAKTKFSHPSGNPTSAEGKDMISSVMSRPDLTSRWMAFFMRSIHGGDDDGDLGTSSGKYPGHVHHWHHVTGAM
ncbi:hypothetical protein F3Y22_tig00004620pilonHSYRG00118 [Hibiscus syriacus]|uniref:Uncharacterized protein n=1 Tax=Hibiscus syriacus TaxID=106335 RepID=A0A6A3CG96_HIBSY|nr:hypothetical protein F3Y22_tig00004620pilonHSYRG00118 [Hibiscus syriacus]